GLACICRVFVYALSSTSYCADFLARGRRRVMKTSGTLRFALAATIIILTAILLQARSRTETIPPHLPLASFPSQLANWDSNEIVQDKKTLEVLGPGDFLERVYQDPNQKLPYVDLFLAYFPSQRAGETP